MFIEVVSLSERLILDIKDNQLDLFQSECEGLLWKLDVRITKESLNMSEKD